MTRLLISATALLLAILMVGNQPVSAAQRIGEDCRIADIPALPADASKPPPAARAGYVFVAGAFRCAQRKWEYIPGHWERARANAPANPLSQIEVRNGRVFARSGFEIVRQGSGAGSSVVLRRAGRSGGAAGLGAISGTFTCRCGGDVNGGCSLQTTGSGAYCSANGCKVSCEMIITINSGYRAVMAQRVPLPGNVGCKEKGSQQAALS